MFAGKKEAGNALAYLNKILKTGFTGQNHMFAYLCPQGIGTSPNGQNVRLM